MSHFYKQGQVEALQRLGLLKLAAPPPPPPPPPPAPPITGGKTKQVPDLKREGVFL